MIPAVDRAAETGSDGAPSQGLPAVEVLGIPVSATSLDVALDVVDEWVVTGAPGYACVTDLSRLLASRRDESLRRALSGARLVLPSGRLLAWYGRLHRGTDARAYSARDLLTACCTRSVAGGYRHFFYGPTEAAVARLVTKLKKRLPDLVIAGTSAPGLPAANGDDTETERRIQDAEPDIVWVGLGTPREECWMASQMARGSKTVMVGVGLAYEVGRVRIGEWLSLRREWHLASAHARGRALREWDMAIRDRSAESSGGGR